MKTTRLKKGLFGLTISLIAVLGLWQASFAKDIRDIRNSASFEIVQNDGKIGLGRISKEEFGGKVPNKLSKSKKSISINPTVLVYAAYTTSTEKYGSDSYWPCLFPDQVYLFVAFSVTDNTKVKVRYIVEGQDDLEYQEEISDSLEADGKLSPNYWYYAWWNPETDLSVGLYDYSVRVKPLQIGKAGKDSCQFEVIEEE